MNKSTEEFLKEITKELKFLESMSYNIIKRIESIGESIENVYERIDNVSQF